MCATNSTKTQKSTDVSSTPSTATKPVPKWLKMKQQNRSSAEKNAKPIAKQLSSAQKPNDQSRNEKRKRWAKKSKPVAKPVVKRGPVLEYISACCSAPATKPPCGQKEAVKDPESGKTKDKAKGLGHFRCTQCRKVAKVTPRKPEPKGEVRAVEGGDLGRGTAIVTEVPIVTA